MSESTITISSKSSPYYSQISTRSGSSVSHNRNLDNQLFSNEKVQLKKLNDQFLSYIERVRLFETYNNCLTIHCEQIKTAQERTRTKLDLLQKEFDEYQQEKVTREKQDFQLENENVNEIEKQVDDVKTKQKVFQQDHDLFRKQIINLQKQSVDLQSKTEQLRYDYENINDDNNHYRKQISYYQLFKSSILDEISHQRDLQQRLQIEVEDLKMQKQISIQANEADTQAIEIHNDNILYDLTTNFRFDGNGKNLLSQMLNEIREEYKIKDHEMREELHRKYLHEYNQHIKKQIDQNLIETNREDIERRHLSNELNSLNDNRVILRQKLALIQEHQKQLELNLEREIKKQKDMKDQYEQQINHLRLSVQEYENLMKNNSLIHQSTIENEVNKYRQLLEGSDQQIGLKQLINMSNKIDRFPPNSRPTTPTPPPPSSLPISKSSSASTLPLFSSRTRQNSISEASYETALPSQSSITTNLQYLTLDSVNDKLFHSDYDTDNDQSQTIQYMSGRSSRLTSETDTTPTTMTPTNQETLPSLPLIDIINHDETIVEIPIDTTQTDGPVNETLPFVPMNTVSQVDIDGKKEDVIPEEQQSPVISTLEQRDDVEKNISIEPTILPSSETIIPITINIDSKPAEEPIEITVVSPSLPTTSVDETSQSTVSPTIVSDKPETEPEPAAIVEVPISTLPATNPLAKLISTMLPNVTSFVPSSNGTNNRSVSPTPIPISTMNNDAPPFVPSQPPVNNINTGQWNGSNTRGGGGGNRRGQSSSGGYHHSGGNQRSGGGGNWQQSGGGSYHKQRRGLK